jgi:hypothetical protein
MNPLGSRLTQVVHSEVALPDACPADLHHPRALVKAGHLSPAADQLLRVQARPARRVKNPLAGHIAEQRQARRPIVIGVEEPAAWSRNSSAKTSYWGSRPTVPSTQAIPVLAVKYGAIQAGQSRVQHLAGEDGIANAAGAEDVHPQAIISAAAKAERGALW